MLFYANASTHIGSGHVMRCIGLAEAFQLQAYKILFIFKQCPNDLVQNLLSKGFEVHKTEKESFTDEDLIKNSKYEFLVVDDYSISKKENDDLKVLTSNVSKERARLIVIDDSLLDTALPADIIVNHAETAVQSNYINRNNTARFLLGKSYSLLRQEFKTDANFDEQQNTRLLITMGGTDVKNLSVSLVTKINQLEPSIPVTLIIGSIDDVNRNALVELQKSSDLKVLENVNNMSVYMLQTRLALTAAGGTLNELAACAVPSIALVVADNQSPALTSKHRDEYYQAIDLINTPALHNDTKQLNELIETIVARTIKLWRDTCLLQKMSKKAKQVIDAKGCERIVKVAEALRR